MQRVDAFDALGNATRRAILRELRDGPLSVVQIAGHFPLSRPAVSRHLAVLSAAGLVEVREVGTLNLYAVRAEGFVSVREFLDDFWSTALTRLQRLARKRR
jgi:DNA-binding transcriptional ArsR family regulator